MIENWFPTPVYVEDLSEQFDKSFNETCYKKILNIKKEYPEVKTFWSCNTYNTLDSVEIKNDTMISVLIDICQQHVSKFSEIYGSSKNVKLKDCWANISEPGCFQERHVHSNSHFSSVYYVKSSENCGNIKFLNNFAEDMFELPIKNYNQYNYPYVHYKPVESTLIIFRSNIPHLVEINKSNSNRCSISMNFVCED